MKKHYFFHFIELRLSFLRKQRKQPISNWKNLGSPFDPLLKNYKTQTFHIQIITLPETFYTIMEIFKSVALIVLEEFGNVQTDRQRDRRTESLTQLIIWMDSLLTEIVLPQGATLLYLLIRGHKNCTYDYVVLCIVVRIKHS